MAKTPNKIRLGAGGHRFGPELECSECGKTWEEHQVRPAPCETTPRSRNTSHERVAEDDEPKLVPSSLKH